MSSSQDVINRSKLPYLPPVTPGMQYRRAQQCESKFFLISCKCISCNNREYTWTDSMFLERDVNKWLRAVGSRFTSEETGQATNEELGNSRRCAYV